MFSYRHAYHAGNHADVLKHTTLLAVLRHMVQKDTAITLLDTHAGAGLYRLDSDYAHASQEAMTGYLRLVDALATGGRPIPAFTPTPAIQDYLDWVAGLNMAGSHKVYPGSPFLMHHLLRPRDRLKLFELHPTDVQALSDHVAQLQAGRLVAVLNEDGFLGIKQFLPPPSARALVLCDPSYEIKSDYRRVIDTMTDALARFATGVYVVWYPIIPRPEAHQLPRKLKTLAARCGRPWLHATLRVKAGHTSVDDTGSVTRPGLCASGLFIINPPHTLHAALGDSLRQLALALSQGVKQASTLESG